MKSINTTWTIWTARVVVVVVVVVLTTGTNVIHRQAENIAIVSLVGVAGATETGSIDDLAGIAALATKYKVHFHVDAAWGGPAIFSEVHSVKMKGIELADTVTLDGHKQLYTPMGVGLCFLRDPTNIRFVQKTASKSLSPYCFPPRI